MPMTYDEYQNKRSWLIDTAETPADQKRLKAQLDKLKAQYDAGKKKAAPKPKTTLFVTRPQMMPVYVQLSVLVCFAENPQKTRLTAYLWKSITMTLQRFQALRAAKAHDEEQSSESNGRVQAGNTSLW